MLRHENYLKTDKLSIFWEHFLIWPMRKSPFTKIYSVCLRLVLTSLAVSFPCLCHLLFGVISKFYTWATWTIFQRIAKKLLDDAFVDTFLCRSQLCYCSSPLFDRHEGPNLDERPIPFKKVLKQITAKILNEFLLVQKIGWTIKIRERYFLASFQSLRLNLSPDERSISAYFYRV